MNYTEVPPPPPLDDIVHCFWLLRGPPDQTPPQTVVPDGRVEIVVHLGEPFAELDEEGMLRPQSTVLLAGQLTRPIRLVPRGPADIVGIRFRTAGAVSVFPFPLHEVTGCIEPLHVLAPGLASALLNAAERSTTPEARLNGLAHALGRRIRQSPNPALLSVVRALNQPRPPRLQHLAARLGRSTRTLERNVLAEVGLSPKMVSRVLRFRRALRLLQQAPAGRSARVAAAAGYYDQAHLIRDFRQFAGTTPSEFLHRDEALARAFLGPDESDL